MSGAQRVHDAFDAAGAERRTAFIAYVLSGYPSEAEGRVAAEAALAAGADLLEIGVPFSDPLADGPTIAAAGRVALAAGGGLRVALRLVESLRERGHDAPILVMSYLNPLIAAGEHETILALRAAGADGLVVPDLPAGASRRLERLARSIGLAMSFLVTPNTSAERVERAVVSSTGFVYVVPLLGVTGTRDELAAGARELVASVRAASAGRAPVAAGFGLGTPEQVAELAPVADGLVVGSALVAALRDGGPRRMGDLVRTLASATERAVPHGDPARDVRS